MEGGDYGDVHLQMFTGDYGDSIRVFRWWQELQTSGDFDVTFFAECRPLAVFFKMFTSGRMYLAFDLDAKGEIWFAAWGEPVLNGCVFLSMWVRKDMRHTKVAIKTAIKLYETIFGLCPVVFGITKQKGLLKIHGRIGYKVVAEIPDLWKGPNGPENGWLMVMTQETFKAGAFFA